MLVSKLLGATMIAGATTPTRPITPPRPAAAGGTAVPTNGEKPVDPPLQLRADPEKTGISAPRHAIS